MVKMPTLMQMACQVCMPFGGATDRQRVV